MSEKNPLFSHEAAKDTPDETLLKGVREGDGAAEELLILRYTRMVRACARPLFLAGGDSEDLLQEGLLGLLDAIREYDSGRDAGFPTFARVCIQNRLRSAVRSAAREKHMALNAAVPWEEQEGAEDRSGPENPEDLVIAREAWREELARISRELSPFEGEVLTQYLEGSSYQEIARATGKPPKAVDNAVQRIRRKLGGTKHGDISAS